jgi:tetratricopeptide (TPR) repeat protein
MLAALCAAVAMPAQAAQPAPGTGATAAPAPAPTPAPPPAADDRSDAKPDAPQDLDPKPSAYDKHMANGVKLFKEQNYPAAIAEFKAAYAAEPKASPLINLALSHKKLFAYAEAITALERAVQQHAHTMDAKHRQAAEAEIQRLRALVAWVTVEVSPSGAKLEVDGKAQPTGKSLALSPGKHRFVAKLDGYKPLEQSAELVSGNGNVPLELKLEALGGTVVVHARNPDAWIEVDGKQLGKGHWEGLQPPGVHVVRVLQQGADATQLQVVVQAGQKISVTQNDDGELHSEAAMQLPDDAEPDEADEEEKLRGFYGLLGIVLLTVGAPQPDGFSLNNTSRFGGGGEVRLGYRVANWAGFELGGQFSDIGVSGTLDADPQKREVTYGLQTFRGAAYLRVMLPSKTTVRFVGHVGGGLLFEQLTWENVPGDVVLGQNLRNSDFGLGGFGQLDLGVELELSNILIDVLIEHMLQSSKQHTSNDDFNAFKRQAVLVLGPALRVGYGLW